MGHAFESSDELEVLATPEQVWQVIATGPGQDTWYLGRNEVSGGLGGTVRSDFAGGAIPMSTVTGWEPGRRLAYGIEPGDDGRFLASEYLIEGRATGSTVLRIVTSGFLPGDDWEAEYDAMRAGSCVFRSSLVESLNHFAGRTATPLTLFGPPVPDWPAAWKRLDGALGLPPGRPAERGDAVRLDVAGLGVVEGELYAVNDQVRGVRTPAGLYRFIQGFGGMFVLCHVVFASDGAAGPWQTWLDELTS